MTDAMTDTVQAWLDETIAGSPISADADSLNHLRGALPTLRRELADPGKRSAAEIARRWFNIHAPGSAISRDRQRWAFAVEALEDLVKRLQPQKE